MLGWRQATQASDRPSGDTAGRETKSLPVASTTPPSALSPCRSSRTSSLAGSGSREWSSRTANTWSPWSTRPPKRHGPAGVMATGSVAPASSRYRRSSPACENTIVPCCTA